MKRKSSGLVQTHYGLACQQCGESVPGNEDWDWCDHITGRGCPWNHEDDYDSSDDEYETDLEDDEEIKALEKAAFGGHEDVWIEVDGHQQRVLGDPNMSEETKQSLAEMIKAVTKALNEGWKP